MNSKRSAALRLASIAAALAALAAPLTPLRAAETIRYYPQWEDGCWIGREVVPVRTRTNGQLGPPGYLRYEQRIYLWLCLPG